MSAFGENVRKYRKQKDLTLKQLADILGIKFQSVEKWEKGETTPKGPTLARLSEALGVTPNDLYYSANEKTGIVEVGDKVLIDREKWEAQERELEYLRTIFQLQKQSPNQQQSKHVKYMKLMSLYGHDFDLYGWKHTGATSLFKATKDLLLVQNQCGHTDVKQTVEYLRDLGALYYESQIEKFPVI